MRSRISRLFRGAAGRLKRLLRSQAGTVTVEFVIWMPVFVAIIAITSDAAKLYLTQADMHNVARDTARRLATGELTNPTAAQDYAKSQMLYSSLTYTYHITQDGTDDTVEISVPVSQACVFGLLPVLGNFSDALIDEKVVMRDEVEGAT
jgi:Flp pilus assembly protein TadG